MIEPEQSLNVSGKVLWELFVNAHSVAVNPVVASNEDIQYEAMDLAVALSELVIEFELAEMKAGRQLPYEGSIFGNNEYEWYIEGINT